MRNNPYIDLEVSNCRPGWSMIFCIWNVKFQFEDLSKVFSNIMIKRFNAPRRWVIALTRPRRGTTEDRMKKFLKGLGAIALLGGLLSTSVPALAETIVVAVGAPKNSLQGRSAEKFATDLQARLGSGYKVEFYSDAQLGNEKELMQKLRLGTVQFTLISSIMTTVANEFAPYVALRRKDGGGNEINSFATLAASV